MNGLDVLDRVQRTVARGSRDLRRQRPQIRIPEIRGSASSFPTIASAFGLDGIAGQYLTHVVAVDLVS